MTETLGCSYLQSHFKQAALLQKTETWHCGAFDIIQNLVQLIKFVFLKEKWSVLMHKEDSGLTLGLNFTQSSVILN